MRRLLCGLALLACSSVWAQQITIPPPNLASPGPIGQTTSAAGSFTSLTTSAVPFAPGTSLVPVYQNHLGGSGTTTNGSFTFTCVSCANLYVGVALYDAAVWPGGTVVTNISGTTITTNLAAIQTNASPVGFQVGIDRWSLSSSQLINTLGVRQLWAGGAAQGNSTWVEEYLPGECQYGYETNPSVTACFLMAQGDNLGVFIGALVSQRGSSSQPVQDLTILSVNDDTVNPQTSWPLYIEDRCMPGAVVGKLCFLAETSLVNFNTVTQSDPFNSNIGQEALGIRIDCGNGGVGNAPNTATNCDTALDIVSNPKKFETGIKFSSGALDTGTLAHPPMMSFPCGANGYSLTGYKATGYSTPALQIYCTNTTTNGNFVAFGDTSWAIGNGTTNWSRGTTSGFTQTANGSASSLIGDRLDIISSGAVAQFVGQGLNASSGTVNYGQINFNVTSDTAGAETGNISIQTDNAGTVATRLNITGTTLNLLSGLALQTNGVTTIDSSRNGTLVNLTASGATVNLSGITSSSSAQTGTVCIGAGGALTYDTTTTCLLSARRFKERITPLPSSLDEVLALNPVSFFFRPEINGEKFGKDPNLTGEQVGFIAEDVVKVDPRLVTVEKDGQLHSVRYEQMTALLAKALQEMNTKVVRQQWEIYFLALWCFGLTARSFMRRKQ